MLVFSCLFTSPVDAETNTSDVYYLIPKDKTASIIEKLALLLNDFEIKHRDSLKVIRDNERRYKIFFDTPDLFIHKNNAALFYEATEYFTPTSKRRKFRETVIYRGIDQTRHQYTVQHYNKVISPLEKHPLLSLIKRGERNSFFEQVRRDGLKFPMRTKAIFQLAENNIAYNIFNKDEKLLCILRLAQAEAKVGGQDKFFSIFSFERSDITDTLSLGESPWRSALLNELGELMKDDFGPIEYKGTNKSEYRVIFTYLENNIKFFHLYLQYPALLKTIYLLMAGFLTWIVVKQIKLKT